MFCKLSASRLLSGWCGTEGSFPDELLVFFVGQNRLLLLLLEVLVGTLVVMMLVDLVASVVEVIVLRLLESTVSMLVLRSTEKPVFVMSSTRLGPARNRVHVLPHGALLRRLVRTSRLFRVSSLPICVARWLWKLLTFALARSMVSMRLVFVVTTRKVLRSFL